MAPIWRLSFSFSHQARTRREVGHLCKSEWPQPDGEGPAARSVVGLLSTVRFDKSLQPRPLVVLDVEELHADMENVLGQTLRMDDSGHDVVGLVFLQRGLQVETYVDGDTRDLSRNPLVSRQEMMGSVVTAAELETAERQVDYNGRECLAVGNGYGARYLDIQPQVLSFIPVHV